MEKFQLNQNKYISIQEAADLHGVTRTALSKAIKKGNLKCFKISDKKVMIKLSDLADYHLNLYSRSKSMYEGELIFDSKKGFYSVKQAAEMLGMKIDKIYYAIYTKRLKFDYRGATIVLHINDIKEYGENAKKRS